MPRNLNAIEAYVIQMRVHAGLENRERNLERACRMIDIAVYPKHAKRVDIIGLPETFATGLPSIFPEVDWEEFDKCAEYIPDEAGGSLENSPTLKTVAEKAKEHAVFIQAGSIIEKSSDGKIYNTACVIDDRGSFVGKYRKVQPWIPEPGGGDEFPVFETDVGNIACMICYDGDFPEISRLLALNGAEVIFRPTETNDPFTCQGYDWWNISNRARAIENHCYIIMCGLVEEDSVYTYAGTSMIVDPYGRVLIKASDSTSERILGATINVNEVRRIRKEWVLDNHFKHINLEAYAKEYTRLAGLRRHSKTK